MRNFLIGIIVLLCAASSASAAPTFNVGKLTNTLPTRPHRGDSFSITYTSAISNPAFRVVSHNISTAWTVTYIKRNNRGRLMTISAPYSGFGGANSTIRRTLKSTVKFPDCPRWANYIHLQSTASVSFKVVQIATRLSGTGGGIANRDFGEKKCRGYY